MESRKPPKTDDRSSSRSSFEEFDRRLRANFLRELEKEHNREKIKEIMRRSRKYNLKKDLEARKN